MAKLFDVFLLWAKFFEIKVALFVPVQEEAQGSHYSYHSAVCPHASEE